MKLIVEIEIPGVHPDEVKSADWQGNNEGEVAVDEAYLRRLQSDDSFYSFKLRSVEADAPAPTAAPDHYARLAIKLANLGLTQVLILRSFSDPKVAKLHVGNRAAIDLPHPMPDPDKAAKWWNALVRSINSAATRRLAFKEADKAARCNPSSVLARINPDAK